MPPECYVISKADWDHLMMLLTGLILFVGVVAVLGRFDLADAEWRIRRFLRRRRIARIRSAAHGR